MIYERKLDQIPYFHRRKISYIRIYDYKILSDETCAHFQIQLIPFYTGLGMTLRQRKPEEIRSRNIHVVYCSTTVRQRLSYHMCI